MLVPGRRRRARLRDRDRRQGPQPERARGRGRARALARPAREHDGRRARHRRGRLARRRPQRPLRRRELRAQLPRPRRRVGARHRGRASKDAFRFLYTRAKLARGGRRRRHDSRAARPESRCWNRAQRVVAVVSGGNVASRYRRCYPGWTMKPEIHPEYVLATVHCACGNEFHDALDQARAARRGVLELPPVLHGQAEADGLRRPRRALPAPPREGQRKRLEPSHELPRSAGKPSSRA